MTIKSGQMEYYIAKTNLVFLDFPSELKEWPSEQLSLWPQGQDVLFAILGFMAATLKGLAAMYKGMGAMYKAMAAMFKHVTAKSVHWYAIFSVLYAYYFPKTV